MFTQHEIASNSRIIGRMSGLMKLDLTLPTYDIGMNPQPWNDWAEIFRSLTISKTSALPTKIWTFASESKALKLLSILKTYLNEISPRNYLAQAFIRMN